MNEDLGRDLDISHNVLNYLNAAYQGCFAYLNMLSQLGYHEFNPDDLTRCQEDVAFVTRLTERLNQGNPVFSMIWKTAQTPDAKATIHKLTTLKSELTNLANHIEKILLNPEQFQHEENIKFLIGAYARFAYTNENYIKGFVDFGKSFTIPEIVQTYESLLPQAEQNIQAAHMFFDIYTEQETVPEVFYQSLYEEALFLPGMFRTNIHDINKFLAIYSQPFDFEHTDIPVTQSEEWRVINVDPNLAGYWHAFSFVAKDMIEWMQTGINAPRQAWFWSCLQFSPEAAHPWIQLGFGPPLAREWAAAGFTADEAVDHIKRGFTNPATAREESKKIIEE